MPRQRPFGSARDWVVGLVVLAACASPGTHADRTAPGAPGAVCPVTGLSTPPPDAHTAAYTVTWYGNDALWVGLSRGYGGHWYALPDGMKLLWWRDVPGPLAITGRRLDAPAPPLRAHIPAGYGPGRGIQSTSLSFPTPGCWEVTGRVGQAELRLIIEVRPGAEWAPGQPTG